MKIKVPKEYKICFSDQHIHVSSYCKSECPVYFQCLVSTEEHLMLYDNRGIVKSHVIGTHVTYQPMYVKTKI